MKQITFLFSILISITPFNSTSFCQTLFENLWVPNNTVFATARSGNTIYIGGAFTYIGPPTGSGALINLSTGSPDLTFARINGPVYAVVPDGSGGWFVGGDFTKIDGVSRNNIAHINSNGTLDANWNPDANSQVQALKISGSTLYVGGLFTSIGGQNRNRIATLSTSTGSATSWNPGLNSNITGILVIEISDSTIYVGGGFSSIGGQNRNNIAAIDASTGNATSWNPNANVDVTSIQVTGSTVYVGGQFTSIGGQNRNLIAAIDATTGNATNWNPNPNGQIRSLKIFSSTLYVGGLFTNIASQTRNSIASFNTSTGSLTTWNPNAAGNILVIEASSSTVYVGGQFSSIGGQNRNHIAAIDATTGNATSWNPNAGWTVYTLALSGSSIYAGGLFFSVGGVQRNHIASIDATTGQVTNWNPNAGDGITIDTATYANRWTLNELNGDSLEGTVSSVDDGTIFTIAVSGSSIYVGGFFSQIGGQNRNNIAEINASTGNATSWNPNANYIVETIKISGSTIYVGGGFSSIGGQNRNNIAAINASTGNSTSWNPNANSAVFNIEISGSTIYVGGQFSSIGGQNRNNIAAIDASTGNATSWNPNANSWIWSLDISGSTVFAGGEFTNIGGQSRSSIAALDISTGNATTWNPNATGGGPPATSVRSIVVVGSRVYVAGSFTSIGGQLRQSVASLDISTGTATDWKPTPLYQSAPAPSEVYSITMFGSAAYIGGFFSDVLDNVQPYFAGVTADGTVVSTSVINGWQTLSVPVVVPDFTKTIIWASSTSNAFSFCGSGYVLQSTLENGIGYYVSFNSNQNIFYAGEPLTQYNISVCDGWNIVGSISEQVPVSTNICLFPSTNSFTSLFYIYKNGYILVNSIIPGMGHWIQVDQEGSMTVNDDPIECDDLGTISKLQEVFIYEENFDHFIFTDAQKKKQDLYVANLSLNPSLEEINLSMPPPLPEVGFDARFEEGEYIKTVSPDSGVVELVINVETESYPVTVSWELNPENGIEYSLITQGMEKQLNYSSFTTMTISSNGKFWMSAKAKGLISENVLPNEYVLNQNYPNPFNPSTSIKYSLQNDGLVNLKIYNILGSEVAELVNEQKAAGEYSAAFDFSHLASGTYFYVIRVNDFTSVKKMLLLK